MGIMFIMNRPMMNADRRAHNVSRLLARLRTCSSPPAEANWYAPMTTTQAISRP